MLNIPSEFVQFTNVLFALRNLHTVCNSEYLPANYNEVIDQFSSSWYALVNSSGISTTPKIHIILDHLCEYFDEMEITLVRISDELVENMHQFVESRMRLSNYKVKDITSPAYGVKLYRAVRHINSYNLRIKN